MKAFFIFLSLLLVLNTSAQNTRINDRNSIGWYNQFVNVKLSEKWSGHLEYQWRRDRVIQDWQQGLFRTAIGYQVNSRLQVRLGYAWIENYPYGDYPLQAAGKRFPEHRAFQMVTLNDKIAQVSMNHRFMLEQRWIGRYSEPGLNKVDEFSFLNRVRYMYRIQRPLLLNKQKNTELYVAAYDEIFLGFGKNVNENVFDQNRLGILLGYRFNNQFRLEAGFLQQILQLGREINSRNVFQYNNGLIINSIVNLDWSKK